MTLERVPHDGVEREVLIDEKKAAKRINELGKQISQDYKGKNPLLVGILKGSFIFLGDLFRKLDPDLQAEVDFMEVSSYGGKQESSRQPKIGKDLSTNIDGRHVIVVEDIVDTGYSFDSLLKILKARNPASLKTCALVSKPDRREVDVPIDYLGFTIKDVWVEGYGMDTDQKNRGLRDVVFRKT
jgi:hypoxanthine phosphoribosyltransferase